LLGEWLQFGRARLLGRTGGWTSLQRAAPCARHAARARRRGSDEWVGLTFDKDIFVGAPSGTGAAVSPDPLRPRRDGWAMCVPPGRLVAALDPAPHTTVIVEGDGRGALSVCYQGPTAGEVA